MSTAPMLAHRMDRMVVCELLKAWGCGERQIDGEREGEREDTDSCPSMLQTYFRAICAGVVPSGEEHQIQGDI